MKLVALVVAFILVALTAGAQTHPCDIDPGTTFTVNAGQVTVQACWPEKDTADAPMVASHWNFLKNGVASLMAMVKVTSTQNATGLFQFQGTTVLSKGNYTCNVEVCGDDGTGGVTCTPQAVPFTVRSKGPGPKPPARGKIS